MVDYPRCSEKIVGDLRLISKGGESDSPGLGEVPKTGGEVWLEAEGS